MTGYTPWPWDVLGGTVIRDASGRVLATAPEFFHARDDFYETRANIRLMAMAPVLLVALQKASRYVGMVRSSDVDGDDPIFAFLDEMNDAIAQATHNPGLGQQLAEKGQEVAQNMGTQDDQNMNVAGGDAMCDGCTANIARKDVAAARHEVPDYMPERFRRRAGILYFCERCREAMWDRQQERGAQ